MDYEDMTIDEQIAYDEELADLKHDEYVDAELEAKCESD